MAGAQTSIADEDKEAIRARLRRIRGQVEGIRRMVEDDRYCLDIVQQLSAVSAGAREVVLLLLEHHIRTNIAGDMPEGPVKDAVAELMAGLRESLPRR